MRTRIGSATLAVALAVASVACSGGDDAGATEVTVRLSEFAITASPADVGAGMITFHVTNDGPGVQHEFMVVRTDLAPQDLPREEGRVDIGGEGVTYVGRIEPMDVGETLPGTYELDAGTYVMFCNLGKGQDHHARLGMTAVVTVA